MIQSFFARRIYFPRHHQRFLVSESDAFACLDRTECRDKSDRSDCGGDNSFGLRVRCDSDKAAFAGFYFSRVCAKFMKFLEKLFGACFVIDGYEVRTIPGRLLGELCHIAAGGERDDAEITEMFDYF